MDTFIVESVLVSKLISDLIPLTSNIQSGDVEAENRIPSEANVPATAIYNNNDFVEGIADEEDVLKSVTLEKVNTTIQTYKDELAAKSRTAKLWIQYIDYINIIKIFIRAERTGNWNLHLTAVSQMLNLFSATGHINYAKNGRLYLHMMLELSSTYPDLHVKFVEKGYHS